MRGVSLSSCRGAIAAVSLLISACAATQETGFAPTGNTVSDETETYSLTIPNGEWLKVNDEKKSDPGSDLELHRKGGSDWITAARRKETRLEEIVPGRRAALLANGARNYTEKRYFLESPDRITASLARYIVANRVVLVLTAIQPPFSVEIIAGTTQAGGVEREIIQILESIRFREQKETP